jgi:sulfur carrier protein
VILRINGEDRSSETLTVADLLVSINVNSRLVVVEYNGEILQRGSYELQNLKDGDRLEIVQMMAGG